MGRKGHPLPARIKRIMQADEDVGKIAQPTPHLIARAMELFLERLCRQAAELATQRSAKTLTPAHLKACVLADELMDFLADKVAAAPELPPEGQDEPQQPKAKRQRKHAEPEPVQAEQDAVQPEPPQPELAPEPEAQPADDQHVAAAPAARPGGELVCAQGSELAAPLLLAAEDEDDYDEPTLGGSS